MPDADPFTIPVAGLLADPAGSSRAVTIDDAWLDLDTDDDLHPIEAEAGEPVEVLEGVEPARLSQPIHGTIRLSRTNRGLLVHGVLATALAEHCSRCLRDIEIPLELDIDEEVLPLVDLASGSPVDTTAEPEATRLTDHHELELEPLVRDAILLAEPIAPLCRPDCPGLCPICGESLEPGPHDHPAEIDPRLEALRDFVVSTDEGETD